VSTRLAAEPSATDLAATPLELAHVVVPLDGSEHTSAALPTARALAAKTGAELVEAPVEDAAAVVARAEELAPSVVVLGARPRGRLAGALAGSLARDLVQTSTAPVVVVGPHADRPPTLVGPHRRRPARFPEPLSVPRLVVAVDGTPASEAALPVAARWAEALGMALAIVTVAEDVALDASGERSNRFGPDDPEAYVAALAERWGASGTVVRDPIGVASGLRSHLALEPAGLLAVTSHARSGLERLRSGATSADIVRTSTVPVLVVPADR